MKIFGRDFPFWAVEVKHPTYSGQIERRFYKISGVRSLHTKMGIKPYYDTEINLRLSGSWANLTVKRHIGISGRIIGKSALYKMRDLNTEDKRLIIRGSFNLMANR